MGMQELVFNAVMAVAVVIFFFVSALIYQTIMAAGAESSISSIAPASLTLLNIWPVAFAAALIMILVMNSLDLNLFNRPQYGNGGF